MSSHVTTRPQGTYRTADLGPPIAEHRFTLGAQGRAIAAVLIGAPIAVAVLMATGAIPLGDDWGPMAYLGTALFFVGMPGLGIALWRNIRTRDQDVVRIHDRGVAYIDRGNARFIPWADVESLTSEVAQRVTNGIPGPITHKYTLVSAQATATFTHGFERIDELAELLRSKTSEVIETRVQEALIAKEVVSFGPLSLSLGGVGHGGATIHWRDAELRFDDGSLVIDRPDGSRFCSVAIARVPNAHVLAALVTRMRARARTKRHPEAD